MNEITCRECDRDLLAYLEGWLPFAARQRLRAHLKRCPRCRGHEQDERRLREVCGKMLNRAGFRPGLMAWVRGALRRLLPPARDPRWSLVAVGAAALLVLALALFCLVHRCPYAHGDPCACPGGCRCAGHGRVL